MTQQWKVHQLFRVSSPGLWAVPNALILKYHVNKIMQVKSKFVPDNIKNEFSMRISFFCFDQNVFWAVAENKTFKLKREV